MKWEELAKSPTVLSNYQLLQETGILDYTESIRSENKELENLLLEAYEIFQQESVDELIDLIISYLSDKFIPSKLLFVLNEGIMVNRIKVLSFRNMRTVQEEVHIESLEPFEKIFKKHTGTTSFDILEDELKNTDLLEPFKNIDTKIVVPVLGISGLYGIIFFGEKILGEEYSASEIAYIDRLMKFTSIAIQNNIHYEHSVKDSKTGLYNHNFFIHRVNEQLARAKRIKKPFSVIVMDIDKFKHFNDTYGHLAGDEVILNLAKTMKKTVREGDILSRFGGEEFTVLLPFAGSNEALIASERFRTEIEKMETQYQEHCLKVTISLGISTFNYYEDLNEQNLLKRADEALYQSKKNGRNQSTIYKSGLLLKAQDSSNETVES